MNGIPAAMNRGGIWNPINEHETISHWITVIYDARFFLLDFLHIRRHSYTKTLEVRHENLKLKAELRRAQDERDILKNHRC